MNCIKSSWDIFTPNWLQKASVTCVVVHLEENLVHGGCGTQAVQPPGKSVSLGNPEHSYMLFSLFAFLPPKIFLRGGLRNSMASQTWLVLGELLAALQSKRLFLYSGCMHPLKGFSPSSVLIVSVKLSDLRAWLPLPYHSWFQCILGRLWEMQEYGQQRHCLHIPLSALCALASWLLQDLYNASAG